MPQKLHFLAVKSRFYTGLVLPWDGGQLTELQEEAGVRAAVAGRREHGRSSHVHSHPAGLFPFLLGSQHIHGYWREADWCATNSCSCFFIPGQRVCILPCFWEVVPLSCKGSNSIWWGGKRESPCGTYLLLGTSKSASVMKKKWIYIKDR